MELPWKELETELKAYEVMAVQLKLWTFNCLVSLGGYKQVSKC